MFLWLLHAKLCNCEELFASVNNGTVSAQGNRGQLLNMF